MEIRDDEENTEGEFTGLQTVLSFPGGLHFNAERVYVRLWTHFLMAYSNAVLGSRLSMINITMTVYSRSIAT